MSRDEEKNVYADSATLNYGPYDFTLLFTKSSRDINNDGQYVDSQIKQAEIRMSPQLGKAIYTMLEEAIEKYENQFGEIPNILKKAQQQNNE